MLSRILIIVIIFQLIGCNSRINKEKKQIKTFNYNGQQWKRYSKLRTIDDIDYKATEIPLVYYLLQNAPKENIDSILKIRKKERIIEFDLEHIEEKNLLDKKYTKIDYESSVKYLSFTIKNDFTLITETQDTIKCLGVLFERNYKLTPYKRLLLYFDNVPEDKGITLIYNDQLFGNGLIKFNLSEFPINN